MLEFTVHKLWSWMPMAGITFGKHIFLKDVQDKLSLEHELVHVQQQAAYGWWFWVSYIFLLPIGWNPFRMAWEAEAYAVQAKYGCPVDDLARVMSSSMYLWPCRRAQAEAEIRKWL